MPTVLLGPNQNFAAPFTSSRGGRAHVLLEASDPVTVYVTTEAGVRAFMERRRVTPVFAEAHDVTVFDEHVDLPPRQAWRLLVINFDRGADIDNGRAVTYQVAQSR